MRRRLASLFPWLLTLAVCAALYALLLRWLPQGGEGLRFTWQAKNYELLRPEYLLGLALLPLLWLGLRYSLADLPWQQRALSLSFRTAFLALLAVSLSRVVVRDYSQKVSTVFLIDVSDSVTDAAIEEARDFITQALERLPDDAQVRLITFAQRPQLRELRAPEGTSDTAKAGRLQVPPAEELRHHAAAEQAAPPEHIAQNTSSADVARSKPGAASNIQAALQLAYGVFPAGYLKHAVLFSDGVETEGDLLAEANRASDHGVKLFTAAYAAPAPGEVAVRRLEVPDKPQIGQPFKVRAEIYASRDSTARARLYQGAMLNGLDSVRALELEAGLNHIEFDSVVRLGGEVTYTLELDRISADQFTENNRVSARLDVPGRPSVLYVEGQPQRASYLASALGAQQFDVDVRPPAAFPGTLAELERYDLLILSDVPAERIGPSSQDLIERYVRDLGGGFIFAGGESGFGLGGWERTQIERILPVRMDVERRKDVPSVAMALVIDRSGSMSGLPMEMAKAACKATVGTLHGDDLVEVIAFDTNPVRYVKMQPARYHNRIQSEIIRIQSGGGTAIFPALDMAYQDISVVQARKKHVILLTDGRADTQGIRDLVQAMVAESITVTTVGLGDGADGDLLRMIAETGGGRYHNVPDPNSLPRIFTRETEMIRRDASVEEWFPVQQTRSADFLRGIALNTAPYLRGYVATQLKGPPAEQILASDTGEPLLARWRVGLGHAVAWTSDVKNGWAVDWLRWSGFGRFWGQLVREHMRKKHRQELDMTTRVIGDRVIATVDAFTPDERFDNQIIAKLSVKGAQSDSSSREVPMRQVAPGRYEADFRLDRYGTFALEAKHFREQPDGSLKQIGVSYGHVSLPYPTEYASFQADRERLQRAATIADGQFEPQPASVFEPGDARILAYTQLWPRFLYAALALFLLDLLVRRVRLFDRRFSRQAG